ncbi:hypothetical protein D3C78_1427190 [compost metagenome]
MLSVMGKVAGAVCRPLIFKLSVSPTRNWLMKSVSFGSKESKTLKFAVLYWVALSVDVLILRTVLPVNLQLGILSELLPFKHWLRLMIPDCQRL